jgi:cytidine deaminase
MDRDTRNALAYLESLGTQYARTMNPDMRRALDRVMLCARDLSHSEEFIIMFCGYCRSKLPELNGADMHVIFDAWEAFKEEMGKETLPTKGSSN